MKQFTRIYLFLLAIAIVVLNGCNCPPPEPCPEIPTNCCPDIDCSGDGDWPEETTDSRKSSGLMADSTAEVLSNQFTLTNFGDGGASGHQNITMVWVSGTAFLKVVESNGPGNAASDLFIVDLSSHTAKMGKRSGNWSISRLAGKVGNPNQSQNDNIAFSVKSDLKMTNSCPMADNSPAAIVGAEDVRNGVASGHHYVFSLPQSDDNINVFQNGAYVLTVARFGSTGKNFYSDTLFCNGSNSTSGVGFWGKHFSYSCPFVLIGREQKLTTHGGE
jgi:hypothetical protein